MAKSIHIGICVKGYLKKPLRDMKNVFLNKDTGNFLSAEESRDHLLDHLSKGHLVIPIGQCPDWDYVHGCPGHHIEDEGKEVANG